MRRVNLELAYRRGNLPRSLWNKVPDLELNLDVVEFIASLKENHQLHSGLFLIGSFGTGKTTHAGAVLRAAAALGRSIFRIEATEVERALSLIKSSQNWVDGWLQEGMLSDVVSIDEMGVETVRGTCGREARSALSYYVKHRYEQFLPTVLCTNLENEEFTEHYGGAISSVVFGSGYLKLSFQGQDRR
jgi:DNA replication protein DnaC